MFANMASQKVQEMVILAEQGNGLFRPLIFSLLSFQFYILFSVLMQIWYLPCFNVIFFFSIDVNTSGSEIEEMKMKNFFNLYRHKSPTRPCTEKYQAVPTFNDPVPLTTNLCRHILTQYHQVPIVITFQGIGSQKQGRICPSFVILAVLSNQDIRIYKMRLYLCYRNSRCTQFVWLQWLFLSFEIQICNLIIYAAAECIVRGDRIGLTLY